MSVHNRSRAGFTLVELLVVIVIISILVTIAIPKFKQYRDTAKETQTAANVRTIQQALGMYATDHDGMYPFRTMFFDDAQIQAPGFNPLTVRPVMDSQDGGSPPWFSLGLWGGVHVVDQNWNPNTQTTAAEQGRGENKHTIVQPYGFNDDWYKYFNEYTDPLTANSYLDKYPTNPFLRRPMGCIRYGYGTTDANGNTVGYDHTLPYEDVITTPGDFVYTFFYYEDNGQVKKPHGIVPARSSYQPTNKVNCPFSGAFYTDHVDSYQLWGYGNLHINSGLYVAYDNNRSGIIVRGAGAKKDWDGNGSKDLFESGIIQYFKVTGSGSSSSTDKTGKQLQF